MQGREFDRYYNLLGIDRLASPEELTRAHRDMAQVWHPDRFTANPRLQRMAEQKLLEVNEAYTVLRGRGKARPQPAPFRNEPPPVMARRFYRAVQAVGVAAVVLGVIVSTSAIYHWVTEPAAAPIMADLRRGLQPAEGNAQPAVRRGRGIRIDAGESMISNGTEIIEPRGRRGVGRVTISNQMERDAVAMLVDSSAPDAVVRMVYVSAGKQVAVDGIGPGIYRLQLSAGADWNWNARDFLRNRTAARPVGPLSFTQVQSAGQVRGDQYSIVLRRDGPGSGEESSDVTMRA